MDASVRETLRVSKQAAQRWGMNLRELNELGVWEQYQIEISNKCAALENLSDGEDINRTWKNIKGYIKSSAKKSLGLHELKQHKTWLMKTLRFFRSRMQAKMQWVQDPSQSNIDNLNNVRREASRHCRSKKKEYLKAKMEELGTHTKIKKCLGLI